MREENEALASKEKARTKAIATITATIARLEKLTEGPRPVADIAAVNQEIVRSIMSHLCHS